MKKYKKIICIITILIFIIGICYLYINKKDKVAIITYHDILDKIEEDQYDTVNISIKKFEEQRKWLKKHNYKSITTNDFYNWKTNGKKIPTKSVLITFDDGWKSFYTKAIPILEKYDMKAAVFVVWSYSKNNNGIYMNLDEIKDIKENHKNIEILSHSYNLHLKENAESNNPDIYRQDFEESKKYYNESEYYAYPFGYRNNNYINTIKENNYKLAFTFGPYDFATRESNNYEIPRIGLFESTPDWKFKLKMFLEM
jgi:peptidoglycan/xylan/chitin deacetylase (PgdA/CDA1 family)